jgi:radial spoke head protein 4A
LADKTNLQDVQYDNRLWNLAGYGFGQQEAYFLQVSLKRLCSKENLKSLKFWGKIFCSKQNYFVAEGIHRNNIVDQVKENWESAGAGCNAVSFWVTNAVMEEWIELPVIGPEHLTVAIETKVMLTGDLNAPVFTHPAFPGKEKHFLKAQLTRITYASSLAPGGVYKINEDNDREIASDADFAWPGREELYTAEKWVHQHPQILRSGRITHYIPKNLDEEAANELKGNLEEKEPYIERLRVITEDARNFFPGPKS